MRVWDARVSSDGDGGGGGAGGSVMTLRHEEPVRACVVLPGGGLLLSAAGPRLYAWDLLGRGKLLHTFSHHQKTVTGLALDGGGSRVLSCALL